MLKPPIGSMPVQSRISTRASSMSMDRNTGSLSGNIAWVTPRALYPMMTATAITRIPIHIDETSIGSPLRQVLYLRLQIVI